MKKEWLKNSVRIQMIFIMLICIIFISGCTSKANNNADNFGLQSKVIENNNSYNIEDFSKIKEFAISLEKALFDYHVNIESISFEYSQYIEGIEKTIDIKINSEDSITVKFNDDEEFELINLKSDCEEEPDTEFDSASLALIHFEFFDFSSDEQFKILELYDDEIKLENYKVEDDRILNMFIISKLK